MRWSKTKISALSIYQAELIFKSMFQTRKKRKRTLNLLKTGFYNSYRSFTTVAGVGKFIQRTIAQKYPSFFREKELDIFVEGDGIYPQTAYYLRTIFKKARIWSIDPLLRKEFFTNKPDNYRRRKYIKDLELRKMKFEDFLEEEKDNFYDIKIVVGVHSHAPLEIMTDSLFFLLPCCTLSNLEIQYEPNITYTDDTIVAEDNTIKFYDFIYS